MTPSRLFLVFSLLLSLTGCATRATLQYDHGRAYAETFTRQADLGRATAARAAYPLTGEEGLALRQRVEEATTDEEKGEVVGEGGASAE